MREALTFWSKGVVYFLFFQVFFGRKELAQLGCGGKIRDFLCSWYYVAGSHSEITPLAPSSRPAVVLISKDAFAGGSLW